jgi:hypothetical protein
MNQNDNSKVLKSKVILLAKGGRVFSSQTGLQSIGIQKKAEPD